MDISAIYYVEGSAIKGTGHLNSVIELHQY